MGGVDLAAQMSRFYTCTHRSSRKWYFRLFWFLLDLAIDNVYVSECWTRDRTPGQGRRKNKLFRKELATEFLSKYTVQLKCNLILAGTKLAGLNCSTLVCYSYYFFRAKLKMLERKICLSIDLASALNGRFSARHHIECFKGQYVRKYASLI